MNFTDLIRTATTSMSPELKEALNDVYGGKIVGNDSLADRAAFGLEVMLIGMGVVFGVLLILIGILQVFKLFNIKKPVEQKSNENVSVAPTPATTVLTANAPASEEETVIAVASAAIAAARGESECAFNIISIKKIVK